MDTVAYQTYLSSFFQQEEALCKRCGACCGARDGDPCTCLTRQPDGRYFCPVYEYRFGKKKTVQGRRITCVSIRSILHTAWPGKETCSCFKRPFV